MRIDHVERRVHRQLPGLPRGARQELLRVLASSTERRADLIRQMYEQPDTRGMAEGLMDLEAEPLLRLNVMEALKES